MSETGNTETQTTDTDASSAPRWSLQALIGVLAIVLGAVGRRVCPVGVEACEAMILFGVGVVSWAPPLPPIGKALLTLLARVLRLPRGPGGGALAGVLVGLALGAGSFALPACGSLPTRDQVEHLDSYRTRACELLPLLPLPPEVLEVLGVVCAVRLDAEPEPDVTTPPEPASPLAGSP